MARGELLRKLFLSHNRGGDEEFRRIALQIIAEEQNKNNRQLARDLLRILENSTPPNSNGFIREVGTLPKDKERDALLVEVQSPHYTFDDIILQSQSRAAVERIIAEFRHTELLQTHSLRPKSKLLFVGPPGCGKTLCAKIISNVLGLPLLYTRFDAIISSYLGETAANLRKVFSYATAGHWVVLFDEVDAIGKRRDDENEHGELKRVVSSFLQLLDGFSAPSLVIAATNHEQLLDPALWRRFDEVVSFPRPSVREITQLIAMKLANFPTRDLQIGEVAKRLRGMSHADVERVCLDGIKACIIEGRETLNSSDFESALKQQKERMRICSAALEKDGQ